MTYDSTGLYTNVYTDLNGCDSTVTLDLTIHESPNDAQVIQNGDTLSVIVSTGTPPYSFLWNTNETTQSIIPDSSGTYWCIVTDTNGCTDWTNQYIYTSTNINDHSSFNLLVYPNPTNGLLNIQFDMLGSKEASLLIVNILGDIVYKEYIDKTTFKYSTQFNLENYSKGIYFVKLKKEDTIITKKIIIQ